MRPQLRLRGCLPARLAMAALLLLLPASCGPWELPDQMPADDATLASPVPAVAIGPIAGAPPAARERLARALAERARKRGIPLAVTASSPDGAPLTLEGTASARQTSRGTVIAMAWDLKNADGIRQHRFIETRTVPTRTPEAAWGPAGEAFLDAVVDAVASQLRDFYVAQLGLEPPEPVSRIAGAPASGITTASLPAAADAGAPVRLTAPVALHLRPVAGEPRGTQVLAAALAAALRRQGAHLLAAPAPGAVVVSGAMVVAPGPRETDHVALDWQVARADGTPLGEVVQTRLFAAGRLAEAWPAAGAEAAQAAAEGIMALVSPEGDNPAALTALRELRGFTPAEAN